jgi:hypothetical protein
MSERKLSPGNALCISCGMCCDGTLYQSAYMENEQDRSLARSLGMEEMHAEGGRLRFRQPCPNFKTCCTVYDSQKPSVCGNFRCELLKKLDKNQISLDEALMKVQQGRALQAAVHKAWPESAESPVSYYPVRRRVAEMHDDIERRRANAPFLMPAVAFIALMKGDFLKKND